MKPAFTAFYDLALGPVSFDFVTWLVRAMRERDKAGCGALHVVIVPKEDGLGGFSRHWGNHDAAAARWRLWRIVIGACPLAEATVTLAQSRAQAELLRHGRFWWPEERAHMAGWMVEAARRGEAVPELRPTAAAVRYVGAWLNGEKRKVVTLSIRWQDTDYRRNTSAEDWSKFAQWLEARGYRVVVLDDANEALSSGRGYAEMDPDLRLALYQRAEMNCIGQNGPAILLWHSAAPFLYFNAALPADPYAAHWEKHLGLRKGDQLPWAAANQRLVYREDTFENMTEEFAKWAGATN